MTECGRLIRRQRMKRGLTQTQLARKLRYQSMQAISGIERGLASIPPERLGAFAFYLGIPKQHLIEAIKHDRKRELEEHYDI